MAEGVLCALAQVVRLGVLPPGLQLDQWGVPCNAVETFFELVHLYEITSLSAFG